MGEPADERIKLVSYDADWPVRFERERQLLDGAVRQWAIGGIHHIGSTSVPGLAAKPVIDILVGVTGLESSRACFEPLGELGYLYAPYLPEQMHWFCKPDPRRRTHHLHLVPEGSRRYRDELAFRDLLRGDPGTASDYLALKRRLAEEFEHDRDGYTDAKAEFIGRALS